VLVFGSDVALKGLVLAEALITGRKIAASESLLTFMD
jgi:hypothetical protein